MLEVEIGCWRDWLVNESYLTATAVTAVMTGAMAAICV